MYDNFNIKIYKSKLLHQSLYSVMRAKSHYGRSRAQTHEHVRISLKDAKCVKEWPKNCISTTNNVHNLT
jgi:hypothetical protein